jgi:F0F1-type ATP synthase membrane subunit b/b'
MSAEIVNLRTARKRAGRVKDEKEAAARRVTHGTPKTLRQEIEAKRDKAKRELDGHRRDPADE